MSITIDLGAVPAHEDCAQLGHTPNFAHVNRFEVLAYRAAIIALHGLPPTECTLTTTTNRHDFGTYYTLAFKIGSDADMAAARAYAEQAVTRPSSWTEAGMAPPVTYDGARPRFHKESISDVVTGALMTTRPDPSGRYPIPAFAALHANLSAAFPGEAEVLLRTMGETA